VRQLQGSGLEPLFPVWQISTEQLGRDMIAAGVKAKITCVDPSKLAKSFAGRDYDLRLLRVLPPEIDPCGENGEFHTFVCDAPVFSARSECGWGKWSSALDLCLRTCFQND
jgi:diphthamide synthase (EF-2-diphthine--ammonia ligase)